MSRKIKYLFKKNFKRYFVVGLGSILSGIGVNLFLVPHHMLSGGVSGIAMILHFLFSYLPIGMSVMVLNIPLFYAAYRLLDREYVVNGIYGMVIFSVELMPRSFY